MATTLQILRSYANTSPEILNDGELAYSFVANALYIGDNANNIILIDRKSTRLNSSHSQQSRMPSSA